MADPPERLGVYKSSVFITSNVVESIQSGERPTRVLYTVLDCTQSLAAD